MISHKCPLVTKWCQYYCSLNTSLKQNVFSFTALDTFEAMGKRLKARRVQDDMDVLYSYLPLDAVDDVDPADHDDVLKEALTISAKEGKEKMDKVMEISFAYFVFNKCLQNFFDYFSKYHIKIRFSKFRLWDNMFWNKS